MFLLDIRYDPKNKKITKWIKDKTCKPVREIYYPKIYISGRDIDEGNINLQLFDKIPGIINKCFEEKSIALGKKPEKVMCLTIDPNFVYDITLILESNGYHLYNIDVSVVRQYLLEKKLFPTAKLKQQYNKQHNKQYNKQHNKQYNKQYNKLKHHNKQYIIEDDKYALDYDVNLLSKDLSIIPKSEGIFTIKDPIKKIYLGNDIIEGEESYIIEKFNSYIIDDDPDLILTNNGDRFEFPYLYYRASIHNIRLKLGRDEDFYINDDKIKNDKINNGRSYFSYGRIYYKPRGYYLSGRLHIDKSSFLFREGGLPGIIDISRITGIPLQEISRLSPGSAVNALQVNQALSDNVLVPWKRNLPESWKTAEQLLISDRGALVIEPKVGVHEKVWELDFVSLFPNIMVNHNISPETVLCDCCPDGPRVPFINYNICEKNIGLIPRVLRPIIDRRLTYKKRAKEEKEKNNNSKSEEYDKKQTVLKWLLVTSFGYMGFNKARFGRIECHESITAYARDILLKTIELADDMGYDVLHGIVDCIWIKGPDPEKLCEIIEKDVGIDLELKGLYNWIVFLPNKQNGSGSLNRYYGVTDKGKLKVRGIELRQGSTPILVRNLQEDILNKLAEAKTASEFYSKIPEVILILKEYIRRVLNNECILTDLIFEIRISKNLSEYRAFNNQVAALRQWKEKGIDIMPGQTVKYIVTDHKSKYFQEKVIIPELIDSDTRYDREQYCKYLIRATESILLPVGYSVKRLEEIINNKIQTKLSKYS